MARKIQPRSKVPKPKKGQSSEEYWRERESRQRAINIRDEARTAERINEIFQSMQDSIQQEIESFYQRYADDEGITLTEARGRVSRIDMEQYERLAKKYVKLAHAHGSIKDMAFTDEANDQMRLYNLTMKVNRLEMLKARCGIRAMEGYRDTERLINENLEERAYSEYRRLAGILGNSVQFNENMVRAIVNASYQNATWSQRLWNHQASLSSQIGTQLASGILAGKSSTVLAREIQKLTGGSTYACQRLMRTELRRVQTEAALQSMTDNGVTEYKFLVANGVNPCDECVALDGKVFKLSEMTVGKNASPMHPSCHCCTAPYVDEVKWQRWLESGMKVPWAEFESSDKYIETTSNGTRVQGDEKNRVRIYGKAPVYDRDEMIDKCESFEDIKALFPEISFYNNFNKLPLAIQKEVAQGFQYMRGLFGDKALPWTCGSSKMDEYGKTKLKLRKISINSSISVEDAFSTACHECIHVMDYNRGLLSDRVIETARKSLGIRDASKKMDRLVLDLLGVKLYNKYRHDNAEIVAYAFEEYLFDSDNDLVMAIIEQLIGELK